VAIALDGGAKLAGMASVLEPALLILLGANGLLLLIYVWGMATATVAARESVRRLLSGECRLSFWGGVVGVGLVLPFVAVALVMRGNLGAELASAAWLAVAGAAIQVGGFLLRDNFLRVGVYGYPL
jgi:formate-dependent nitrite reductase membrane component NrfD